MTREQKLMDKLFSASIWWYLSGGATCGVGVAIYMDKTHWLALIVPLWLFFDTNACIARHKIELYTLRLLGKQNEPAQDAEENA